MAKIVPKLNLNKTPQGVDNYSLIFAKNIKLLKDNTIGRDSCITKIDWSYISELDDFNLVGYIPYNTVIYLFFYKPSQTIPVLDSQSDDEFSNESDVESSSEVDFESSSESSSDDSDEIITIPEESIIYEYNELAVSNKFKKLNTGWKYSGGIIEGMVTVNLRKDVLITINEYFEDYDENTNPLIPIKTINLSEAKATDDENIYSNAPIIPVLNLVCLGTYDRIIPNGVYQFFVRYEIIKDYYTEWFPCSPELFTANIFQSDTTQGTVRYMKSNIDTNESFIFKVDNLNKSLNNVYKSFQIGYIISHDDSIKAKSWKHFPINTDYIRFDYDVEYTEDIEISELIRPVLNLYNVKNLTNFKNKFYISNYIESDYNKDLNSLVQKWKVSYTTKTIENIGTWLYRNMAASSEISTFIDETDEHPEEPITRDIIRGFASYDTVEKIINNRDIFLVGKNQEGPTIETTAYACEGESESNAELIVGATGYPYVIREDVWNRKSYIAAKLIALYQNTGYKQQYEDWYLEENPTYKFYSLNAIVPITNNTDIIPTKFAQVDQEYCIDAYQNNQYTPDDTTVTFGWNEGGFEDSLSRIIYHILGFDVETGKSIARYNPIVGDEQTKSIIGFRIFYTEFRISKEGDDQGVKRVTPEDHIPGTDQGVWYKFFITTKARYRDCSFNLVREDITNGSNFEQTNIKTLIPFQKYNFYIHFVKDTGETTNGYFIDSYTQPYVEGCTNHVQIIPKFVFKNYNNGAYDNYINSIKHYGYKYYFFSICKVENQVAELFNRSSISHDRLVAQTTQSGTIFDCIDIDTLQIPLTSNIPIYEVTSNNYNQTTTKYLNYFTGTYVDSGQLEDDCTILFGRSGKVIVKYTNINTLDAQYFIILKTNVNTDILDLIKCTKYYKLNTVAEIKDDYTQTDITFNNDTSAVDHTHDIHDLELVDEYANLQDYICKVSKNTDHTIEETIDNNTETYDEFISSSDYFKKSVKPLANNNYTISLEECKKEMPYRHTDAKLIYSTFNLNFLELTNDVKRLVRKYEEHPEEDGYEDTSKSKSYRQLTSCFDSLTLSTLYTFPSMFKNYTRKYYEVYNKDSMTVFNNTIRCSELEGDEVKTFVYKFLAEVTYNVPTDKGYIVNLISAGDVILVHTQDSVFKFTGRVALSSADNNVQTVETDVFDIGIQEIVGSRYGFAGLKNKNHTLLSQFGYIFWDADCNVIYAYTGEGQMTAISNPINKLLKYLPIETINFCEDYYNDRFFIQITYKQVSTDINDSVEYTYPKVVLSYNIKAKSFVSLHDFSFEKTFNTKINAYFTQTIDDKRQLYKLVENQSAYTGYGDLLTIDNIYPTFKLNNKLNKPCAVIDIIYNTDYESIKTLDSISWICSEIDSLHIVPEDDGYLFLAEESLDRTYPGTQLMIYSDSCASELLDIIKSSNDYPFYKRLVDNTWVDVKQDSILPKNTRRDNTGVVSTSYKYPRYNLGKWNFNYFRNIRNNKNTNISDNNSLIYGKYFIFRFIFDVDVNFKFENLIANINNNYDNN